MNEPDAEPIAQSEHAPSTERYWLNTTLLIALAAVPVVGALDHYVPAVHRVVGLHHEIHLLCEAAIGGAIVVRRTIRRRFSRQPIEKMPDWL